MAQAQPSALDRLIDKKCFDAIFLRTNLFYF
ncbi:MAG: hypothetical protein AWM53_02080 [Candidatus Dichloromethanomonas elyunquensis]|nr:MAG: hypothetical protein AWM53_02080 [Candidatus Dichloromethanomonas elyunquensis]